MLRKIVAGTSAAVVAAGLAAAPAAATGLPGSPADPCADRTCITVAQAVADFSSARRNSSAPPPIDTPAPEGPSSPPPDDSGPGGPGPGDSAPAPAAPPLETAGPPVAPDFTPVTAPPPLAAPTSPPAEPRRPSEAILPTAERPPRLPQTAVDSRPLTVAGGGSLIAAGLAWIGGARRKRKRPAGPSSET